MGFMDLSSETSGSSLIYYKREREAHTIGSVLREDWRRRSRGRGEADPAAEMVVVVEEDALVALPVGLAQPEIGSGCRRGLSRR
jgi:hypothetical protein